MGKLIPSAMLEIAEFERTMKLERQREGIATAKSEAKYKGRQTTAWKRMAVVMELAAQGLSMGANATKLGTGEG